MLPEAWGWEASWGERRHTPPSCRASSDKRTARGSRLKQALAYARKGESWGRERHNQERRPHLSPGTQTTGSVKAVTRYAYAVAGCCISGFQGKLLLMACLGMCRREGGPDRPLPTCFVSQQTGACAGRF